jgi:predicted MFS family arabinose efflux permease
MKRIASLYRNAFGGLEPATWWLSLVMLVNRSGTMVVPFMTLYLTQKRHFTIGQAGWVMSIFGIGAVCGAFIGGKLTDRIGFHRIQLATLSGGGICFILLGHVSTYPLICVFTFVLSLVNESFRPANYAAIAHYCREDNRTRSVSLNRLAINTGWAVGGALGGFIAATNYHLLFWIDGITNLAAALLLYLVLRPGRQVIRTQVLTESTGPQEVKSAYQDKPYLAMILLTVMFAYCFFQLFTTQPVFYKEVLHLSEPFIGMIMALNGAIIGLFEMLLVFHLENRRAYLYYTTIGIFLCGISFLILNIFPGSGWLAFSSMLLVTLGEMLSMSFLNAFWMGRSQLTNRGQYAALYTAAWSTAQVIGPGTGAQIAQHYGFRTLWWVVGGICLLTSAGFRWLRQGTSVPVETDGNEPVPV